MKLVCALYFLLQLVFPVYVVTVAWVCPGNFNISIWSTVLAGLALIPNLLLLAVALSDEEHKNED